MSEWEVVLKEQQTHDEGELKVGNKNRGSSAITVLLSGS